ncbi:MAG: cupin domain-containing protein [Opitutae bacterium]|jgi:quercetin 2,3-dioxygenase|nr:cupin domain-containing protein [Opitutae bacterium]
MPTFKIRRAEERGTAEHGWLHARFTFSFADYYEPKHCGFHSLVVMNNDLIEPGGGFGTHPHDNAEIFTYVISGELEHKDSMGNGSIIKPGHLQYMSAGDGVFHSEFNPSNDNQVELYQIWMLPNQRGGKPIYEEKELDKDKVNNDIKILFSEDGHDDSTPIRQNATIGFGQIDRGNALVIEPNNQYPHAWIQIISGTSTLENYELNKADGIGIENLNKNLTIQSTEDCDFFIFRLSGN